MFRKTAFRALLAVAGGGASFLGYKAYQKSVRHPPILKYATNDHVKFEKDTIQYKLKSRDDHINEASTSEYDVLIIGDLTI
jgi:hypothetical protein